MARHYYLTMDRSRRRRIHKQRRYRSRRDRSHSADSDNFGSNNRVQLLQHRIDALESLVRATNSRDLSDAMSSQRRSRSPRDREEINKQQRYVGRMELIPEFDGTASSLTINQWLTKIDAIGDLYHWDSRAKIFAMIGKLSGNAKLWFECQSEMHSSDWNEWKEKLVRAFPSCKGIATNLKEFINTERKYNENIVSFYYSKLKLGKHCELSDHVITDVIISTLNDDLLKSSAYAAGCKNTEQLLKFLVESNYEEHKKPDKRHISQNRTHNNANKGSCFVCGKSGHKAVNCFLRKSNQNNDSGKSSNLCNYCKKPGHTRDNCFSLQRRNKTSTTVNTVSLDDAKYHVTAKLNNIDIPAYIDFGSACNIIKLKAAKSLELPIDFSKQTTMRGYGGALVTSLGETSAKLRIDEVERDVPILVVNDMMQNMDLLIGRTFTEASNLLVIKTNDKLLFQNEDQSF